jgi:cobalt-zinc-cadmium efflux system membrane fusion protein
MSDIFFPCIILAAFCTPAYAQDNHDINHIHIEDSVNDDKTLHEGHEHSASNNSHSDHEDSDTAGHDGHGEHGDNHVSISSSVLREFNIIVDIASSGTLREKVVLPGAILFNRERLALVTPRLDGTVKAIEARLADRVVSGQTLATLESTETLRPFQVKAPFDGVVVDYAVMPGATVEAGVPLFTVADLSSVWADLRIYQRDLGKIDRGLNVVIESGHAGPRFAGTIVYVAPTIDVHTRTGLARVIVDNEHGTWMPGQFVTGSVSIAEHEVDILVPRSAVLTHEGTTVVFVQTDDGFEPRPVELGHNDAASHEVVNGLERGETYVARNAISIKAEMSKGSFGGHAGHVH